MLKAVLVALALGAGATGAYLLGRAHNESAGPVEPAAERRPEQPPAPPVLGPPSAGATLESVLEGARRSGLLQPDAPQTPAQRRLAIDAQLAASDPIRRRNAFRALVLEDRHAAEAVARQRLGDPVLFVEAARLLLGSAGAVPDAKDLAQVRKVLRTGKLDEPSRAAVSILVLETLVRIRSPAALQFAAGLLRSPSDAIRAATPKVMTSMSEDQQVPLLLGALADRAPPVRQAARAELTYVARRDLGDNPAAWTDWWKARSRAGRKPTLGADATGIRHSR